MTPEQKEIRDAERKAFAEVRAWKRKAQKKFEGMTEEEEMEYWEKYAEELKAEGFNVVSTEEHFRREAERQRAEGSNVVSGIN